MVGLNVQYRETFDTVTNAQARIYLAVADNDSNFDGDNKRFYIWGAQLEATILRNIVHTNGRNYKNKESRFMY